MALGLNKLRKVFGKVWGAQKRGNKKAQDKMKKLGPYGYRP